jgi:hypothetical protein
MYELTSNSLHFFFSVIMVRLYIQILKNNIRLYFQFDQNKSTNNIRMQILQRVPQ